MMNQEVITESGEVMFPPSSEVVELVFLLPSNQFCALGVVAGQLNLTVGQLLRRTVSTFLTRSISTNAKGG